MGYKIIQEGNNKQHDIYDLVVDTLEDLNALPDYIDGGSTAIILKGISGGVEVRIKSPAGEWVAL